jgi:hypothetical protein
MEIAVKHEAGKLKMGVGVKMFAIEDAKAEGRLRPKAVMAVKNYARARS